MMAGIGFTSSGDAKLLGALAGVVGLFVMYTLLEILRHLRFEYALTSDTLDVASGIVSRRERNVPVRRVQTLDISQGPLARLVGVAAIDLETAGGGETEVSLKYVADAEARRLQNEIQRLKQESDSNTGKLSADSAGIQTTESGAQSIDASEGGTSGGSEGVLFDLPLRDLLLVSAVRLNLRPLLPITLGVIAGTELLSGTLAAVIGRNPGLAVLVVVVGTVVAGPVATFARYYDFQLTDAGDELRYERGLLQRYSGSIPLGKIQTLLIHENVLERRFGYAGLDTITAGYAAQEVTQGTPSAIPLTDRESVFRFARSIEGFDFEDLTFTRPPKRARRRYAGRYVLFILFLTGALIALETLAGAGTTIAGIEMVMPELSVLDYWYAPLFLVPLVPVIAHLKWRNRGYAIGDDHVLTRNGFWNRGIEIVPYYRIQTVIHRRSIFQRRLGLATVVVDSAGSGPLSLLGGSARAIDIDAEEATELRETIHQRFGASLTARRQPSKAQMDTL